MWRMADVLNLYAEPYNPRVPGVCFEERPDQLIGETRTPLPLEPGKPLGYDFEDPRQGTCTLFVLLQP